MRQEKDIDFYDTGQWHLTVDISPRGMTAFLRHLDDATAPVRMLLDEKWKPENTGLLSRIENTVYDHPAILDDYSATILIRSDRSLWAPAEAVAFDEGMAEKIFSGVYAGTDPDDIFVETDADLSFLYASVPGLKAFLARTFPGARISGRDMVLLRKFRNYPGGGSRVYIHVEKPDFTVIAFEGKKLLCSSARSFRDNADILYALLLTMRVYGLDEENTEVFVSGSHDGRAELMKLLRGHVRYVMLAMQPSPAGMETISPAAVMASLQTIKKLKE